MPEERVRPRGVGTPFVESLTSIVRRLAEWDARTVAALLEVYVTAALRQIGRPVPGFIPGSLTEAVNGSTTLTAVIVDGLAAGFDLVDLSRTTLLGTAGQLFSRRDSREVRAWCPLCLAENGYDQLIWAFTGVTVCVRHGIRLVTRARCGHEHRPWVGGASTTGCASCGHPLSDVEVIEAPVSALTTAYVQVVNWLQSGRVITRGALAAGLQTLIASGDFGPTQLARRTGLSIHTIGALRSGRTAPQLGSIVAILAHTTYRLEDLLSHGVVEPAARRRYGRPRTARRDLAELERILVSEALLPRERRRSLAEIGAAVGVGARYASQHFPNLVTPWSDPATRRWGRRRVA